MRYIHDWNGNQVPIIRKYQVGEDMANAGVPVEVPTLANTDGVLLCATTTCADCLGVTLDAQDDRQTAQQTDDADPQRLVSVVVNPNAIFRGLLSGGATRNTALTLFDETAGDLTGLLVTAAIGTAYDDGYCWGFDGANMGHVRKITAVDGSTAVPIVAFPKDIAIGDNFLAFTAGPGELAGFQLCTTLDQINATADLQGTDNFRIVSAHFKAQGDEGRTRSAVDFVIFDHLFAAGGSI